MISVREGKFKVVCELDLEGWRGGKKVKANASAKVQRQDADARQNST